MASRVVGHLAELAETALARRRVPLLQALLVRDRLLLHILDVQGSSRPFVGIEIDRLMARSAAQEFRQMPCLVDAAVQAKAADRVVDMRGVAAKEHAALAEALCHAY